MRFDDEVGDNRHNDLRRSIITRRRRNVRQKRVCVSDRDGRVQLRRRRDRRGRLDANILLERPSREAVDIRCRLSVAMSRRCFRQEGGVHETSSGSMMAEIDDRRRCG